MIAREGTVPIALATAGAVLVSLTESWLWLSVGLWVLCMAAVWIYYEPRPNCRPVPFALVASMSGTVSKVDSCWNPWLNLHFTRIRVEVSAPYTGTVWAPTEGKILDYWTKASVFDGPSGRADADRSPNCYAVHIRTDECQDAVLALSSLSSTRPISALSRLKLDVGPGDRTGQGRRMGFGYFVGHIDLLLDSQSAVMVSVGERTSAGETVLAEFDGGATADRG